MKPEAYIDMMPGKETNICIFDVVAFDNEETNPTVTLGLGFLRSFEVIFDYENNQIGIYSADPALIIDHG